MRPIDTLLHARWVIPVEPEGVVLEDHAVAISDGEICEVLPSVAADRDYQPRSRIECPRHALIPGLVNTHTHAAMNLLKGYSDDKPLMEWLYDDIWPVERRWMSEEFVRDGTRLAIAEMLRSGTTCFNDMYFFPDEVGRIAAEAGIRAVVGLIVIDHPTVWAKDVDEYLAKGTDVHDRFRHEPLVSTAFAPHAPYSVGDAGLTRIRVLADELDIPVHMHVHETASEVRSAAEADGERPLDRLDRLQMLSPRLLAVHMTQLTPGEIARVAECGTSVIHCPESNLKLASGFCPVQALISAGVNVALGTDGAASNNDLDMLGEMRTASYLAKAVGRSASAVPAARALSMATVHGASALGLHSTVGSLVAGKSADIVALDLCQIETTPVFDPIVQIVYACSRQQVTDVWIAGRRVLERRRLPTLDEEGLAARALEWQQRLSHGPGT